MVEEKMKNKVRKHKVYILELTEAEASWLHTYMQNPAYDNEDAHDGNMRARFFKATDPNNEEE